MVGIATGPPQIPEQEMEVIGIYGEARREKVTQAKLPEPHWHPPISRICKLRNQHRGRLQMASVLRRRLLRISWRLGSTDR